ncbi:hypothetical protein CLOBOL_06276 [Enterocloster bolteae ATCC BAA-613]|uniref:Uncharacterized protein n=1 Tax=Enterocloster bolteae (strain ATCC BAA-613 / DSM 15670 / CCUG 46953 / JCM 12243 / WAL 16351) TaxID=411902 RepID=A8S250_ENTBW|nr:hypothetical protein CLOBOL_06276 [Enterocloster bolteae ATCC BAA-613]
MVYLGNALFFTKQRIFFDCLLTFAYIGCIVKIVLYKK